MKIIFFLTILISTICAAETTNPQIDIMSGSCKPAIEKFCPNLATVKENLRCLKLHDDDLTSPCKQEIERWIQTSRQAMNRGGGALGSFGGSNPLGPTVPMINYEGRFNKNSNFLDQHKINISAPLGGSDGGRYGASLAAGALHVGKNISLDSGTEIPEDLYRTEIGAQYFQQKENKDNWGIRTSIGYAGDDNFQRISDASFSLTGHYSFNPNPNGFWIATVFLGNNTPLGNYIPIPGFIYFYRTPSFTGLFGFPILSLQWTPAELWSYGVSLFGPTLNAEVNYGTIDTNQFFANFGWVRQSYILKNRIEDKDRLTLEEKKLGVGLRTPVFGFIGAEFQIFKSFDRQFYVGQGLFKKDGGQLKVDEDWSFSMGLRAAY